MTVRQSRDLIGDGYGSCISSLIHVTGAPEVMLVVRRIEPGGGVKASRLNEGSSTEVHISLASLINHWEVWRR